MADVITPNYNFTIPDIAGSDDTWGIKLNANWGLIDTLLFNISSNIENKVSNERVLTNVPENAVFTDTNTDTIYTKPISEEISYINGLENSLNNKVNASQVLTDVPIGAVFTDTVHTKPTSEPISYIDALQEALDQLNNEVTQATASISGLRALALAGI
jgi:hypothetical protein